MNSKRLVPTIVVVFAVVLMLNAGELQVAPLGPNGAPGFENRRNEPELAKDFCET
jgi:hypothetical protein